MSPDGANGPKEITDVQIHRALGRIEGKLDGIIEEQRRLAVFAGETNARHEILANRVGGIENTLGKILGWAAGVGVTGGVTGAGVFATLARWLGG
jgi:hypothetical protein